ncbi:hypothetical protein GCM10010347_20030 [Streptomyces cirratus]|uniref:Uncharacterized protein n=1 Tax=Streptomyces cirratus TaxID=68187 RepID=A0ABQ3EXM3_9ACTN|nr:hypothetical protein [Streptomyces cirratus]GHB50497.1 hypothetical protein GCM10010347_20030 [Streptomyces cirratus]
MAGTPNSDNLTDRLGVPLEVTTAVFAVAPTLVFVSRFRSDDGGPGLGTAVTSELFLPVIAARVLYLTATRMDVTPPAGFSRPAV